MKKGLAVAALALAFVALAVVFLARGGVEAQIRDRLTTELRSRLGGDVELRGVRVTGREALSLEGFSWSPANGPVGLVTVERLDLTVDTGSLLDGDARLGGGELAGLHVVFSRSEGADASTATQDLEVAPLAELARWLAEPVPARMAAAVHELSDLVEEGAVIGFEQGQLSGLTVGVDGLAGEWTFRDDGVSGDLLGRVGERGAVQGSVSLRPGQPLDASLSLTSVPLDTVATQFGVSAREDWEGGVVDLDISSANLEGEVRWDTSLDVRDLVVRLSGFKGVDWPIRINQRFAIVPAPDGGRIDIADWRWSFNGVSGTGSGHVVGLEGEPEIRLVAQLEEVPFWTVLQALPLDVIPAQWGLEVRGTLDLTARFNGPLHDRSRWDLGWKGDWSRLSVYSAGVGGDIAELVEAFPYTIDLPDGTALHRVMGAADPHFIGLGFIHSHLQAAAVVCEDSSFYVHKGFDERELREAIIENLREPGGGRGGSTITQQVAKNLFLSGERTWTRKLQEAILAWGIEQSLGKARILEIYLNLAQFGPGIYGVRDAAHHYFGTSTRQLNTMECVFLATILPSPDRYHDYYHPQGLVSANWDTHMRDVLQRMRGQGYLGEGEFGVAQHQQVRFARCDRFSPAH